MAVRWATRPDQQTIVGTLADLADRIEAAGMKPPATVVIGEVVRLREKLNWFERLPLFGTRIAITRAATQAAELRGRLESLGAEGGGCAGDFYPATADTGPLDAAIARLAEYDWLILRAPMGCGVLWSGWMDRDSICGRCGRGFLCDFRQRGRRWRICI